MPHEPNDGPSLFVLIAEDNRDGAETTRALLELFGHTVCVAFDGETAVRLAEQRQPDVAILDIGLPGMNGLAVAQELRALAKGRRPLLVALTALSQEHTQQSLDAGFDAHLTKPADPKMVLRLLERFKMIVAG